MTVLHDFLIFLASFWAVPVITAILIMIFASFGISLGIREKYVELLLAIFEWGRVRIEKSKNGPQTKPDEDDEIGEALLSPSTSGNLLARQMEAFAYYESTAIKKGAKNPFTMADSYDYVKWGMEAITEDQITKSFEAEEISSWNMLTRTNMSYQYISMRLTLVWVLGFIFRYFVLVPIRLLILIIGGVWLSVSTFAVGYLPPGPFRRRANQYVYMMCNRIIARGFSAILRFHNKQNKAQAASICVANHTSPMDGIVLSVDNCYSMIGQRHKGILGYLQKCMSRASEHIWFERSEAKDRSTVSQRLRDHVAVPDNCPILIFPEGTCISNNTVMMFKKGCFEVGCTIYPVAIKYDPRFGDAFWNSSKQTMGQYMLMMMTSWAIVADVWYLPPMDRKEGETGLAFAARVKNEIAKKGGLVELDWDGDLKRTNVKKEWKEMQQKCFSERMIY